MQLDSLLLTHQEAKIIWDQPTFEGGQEDLLEKKWQPTPVFWPGESPRTEEPDGLQSVGLQGAGQD